MTKLDEREQRTLTKRCTKCGEVKPLEEFRKDKRARDGRGSRCRVCHAKRAREAYWEKQGIPPEAWPRLHEEAEARADRRNSAPDGFKVCTRCHEVRSLKEFPPDKSRRGGRHSWCRVCHAERVREARWTKQGVPPEAWTRLHEEAERKAEAQAERPVERQRIMRELAKRHGLKYCPDCDMCLGKAFFRRDSRRADGLQPCCRACQSARKAAYLRTPAGRASAKGYNQRYRAKKRNLPTDGTGPRDWAAWAEEQDDFDCYLCGGMLTAEDEIHWDHVDPISTGTTGTVLHNMRAVHARCNLMRGNRSLEEWWAATGLLDVTV